MTIDDGFGEPLGVPRARRWRVFPGAEVAAMAILAVAVVLHAWIFLPLTLGRDGIVGGDYALHYPNLLAGRFLFLANGPLSVPWFNPAQCGGVPFIADLNVAFYSLPQALTLLVDPGRAVAATFVVFAALGTAGMYLLCRQRFQLSPGASVAGAVLFLFNGFYAYRMAVGHLTFHPFMLTPWLAWAALAKRQGDGVPLQELARATLAVALVGIVLAYAFHAGMIHIIAPVAIATAVVVAWHGYLFGYTTRPWIVLGAGGLVALLIAANRIASALAFIATTPRDLYKLSGIGDLRVVLDVAFNAVFLRVPFFIGRPNLVNYDWTLEVHEWEYGVGVFALVLIGLGAVALAVRSIAQRRVRRPLGRTAVFAAVLLIALSLPLALNFYEPGWNAFLKTVPVLGSSTTLLRWFVLYIPLAALAAALAVGQVPGNALVAGTAVLAATAWWNATANTQGYVPFYDGRPIVGAWQAVSSAEDIPPIVALEPKAGPLGANAMISGTSALGCYQPMFGYRLEQFPATDLRPGFILDRTAGGLNMANPACYLFGKSNECRPGDVFREDQAEDAIAFAQYRAFAFVRPTAQVWADRVNLAALVVLAAAVAGAVAVRTSRRSG